MSNEDVQIQDLEKFSDSRGFLLKFFSSQRANLSDIWKFENSKEIFLTNSHSGVFRGLHAQIGKHETNKLVVLLRGKIVDFLLDLRQEKPSYGDIRVIEIDETNPKVIYVPIGFAHGYYVRHSATVLYFYDNIYCPKCELVLGDNRIEGLVGSPISTWVMSEKDKRAFVNNAGLTISSSDERH